MTRRMYAHGTLCQALIVAVAVICAADRALSRMNRRQRALAARARAHRGRA